MRLKWRDLPALLRTPLGRKRFVLRVYHLAFPLLSRLAMVYRKTLLRNTLIIAVIGSLGKTTTTRAIHFLCKPAYSMFEHNAGSSLALAILRMRPFARDAVLEVGIEKPGEMASYARMFFPNMTVVTSIASEHNTSFRSLEQTRIEKSEMVRKLPKDGVAVLNGDDPNVLWMSTQTRARVVTFGLRETNDVYASDIMLDWPNGTKFQLHVFGKTQEVQTPLFGRVMVYPVLAAIAAALGRGLSLNQVLPNIGSISPSSGRLEPIRLSNGSYLLSDDHKSPLESIYSALETLAEIPAQRRMVVLGDVSEPPGSIGPIYRDIGNRVATIASKAIFISLSKRVGDYYVIGAKSGGLSSSSIIKVHRNLFQVIEILKKDLSPGDVVLIKGRTHQHLDRISLALTGKTVRCHVTVCSSRRHCQDCPMLERGWDGLRFVI